MAPRNSKAKKAADVKLVPKASRSKEKILEVPEFESVDTKLEDKVVLVAEKKTKQKKKPANDDNGQELNGNIEEAVPVKKGKKKNDSKSDEGIEKETSSDDQNNTNGHAEDGAKVRKKKHETDKSKPNDIGKGKTDDHEQKEALKEVDDKPKTAKSRGRKAQPKIDKLEENIIDEEKVKGKGKKKVQAKGKEQSLQTKQEEENVNKVVEELGTIEAESKEDVEEKPEPKPKGRRVKKTQDKAVEEVEDVMEEAPAAKKRKVAKKGKGDSKEEDDTPEVLPVKIKRGQKKTAVPGEDQESENVTSKRSRKPANDKGDSNTGEVIEEKPKSKRGQKKEPEEAEDTGESTTKRRRKQPDEKALNEDKKKPPLKNKSLTDYDSLDFSNTSKTSQGKAWNFKISSWNVDGIRAWLNKGGLDYVKYEKPDILCLQEIKCSQDKLPNEIANLPGYHAYWLSGDKDGYAGVGIYTTKLAMNVQYGLDNEELDSEGRIITAEYEHFYLICTYVPNAGRKLVTLPKRLKWNEQFLKHVKQLDAKKPVIICGDMNVAHNEIDLANPKTNKKNAGFTEEERAGMTQLLAAGFVDTYRRLNPDQTGVYTFWTYMMNSRAKNVGWRLDYFIVSERLAGAVCDSVVRGRVLGSDHCPVALLLRLAAADRPQE